MGSEMCIRDSIDARLEYFTCVMIGAVSAGKTSLICDLAQLSPEDLNRRIKDSGQSQFESGMDDIEIGPSVATTNLYELLFQRARMRLVDVPGIGGVVHSNDTLAPFVRLADCVIFMISADRDIMKDDLDFIRNHILNVALQKEGGVDKSRLPEVVVVVNKWLSNKIDECSSREQLDAEFEERRNWILEGDPRKGFDGIAKYFGGKTPHIVWTETTRRNSQGDILQKWQPGALDSRFTVDGILTSVSTVLAEDGPEVRLSRPLRVLRSDMMSLKTFLFEVNVQGMLQGKFDQLETVSQGIQAKEDSARERLQQRLDRFERRVSDYVSSSLRATLSGWKPSIGVIDGTIGAFSKDKMQDRLSGRWGDELRSIIDKDFDFDRFNQMIDDEAREISRTVAVELQRYIQGEDGKIVKEALSDTFSEGDQMSDSFGGANDSVSVDSDSIAKNIEMGIMKSIGSLLTANIILAVVASSFLTPLGGALVVALQRMWQGGKQKAQAREKLFDSIDLLSADSAQKIRKDVQAEIEKLSLIHI